MQFGEISQKKNLISALQLDQKPAALGLPCMGLVGVGDTAQVAHKLSLLEMGSISRGKYTADGVKRSSRRLWFFFFFLKCHLK